MRSRAGVARLGFVDVLTALILLAILLWASWKQFPAYGNKSGPSAASSVPATAERDRPPRR